MSVAANRFRHRVVLPIALMVAGMIVVVILLLLGLAQRQTSDALANERSLAEGMLRIRLAEIEKLAGDYSYWDEAFDNLVTRPDAEWAEANIGPSLREAHGIDMSFVAAPDGSSTFGMVDGADTGLRAQQALQGGLDQLLAARAAKGPDASHAGILVADGVPVLAAVAPLRPFARPDDGDPAARHILVVGDRLEPGQLARFSELYRLPGLHVAPSEVSGEASIEIRTFDGKAAARLAWIGADPGHAMLRDLLPLIVAVLVAFAVFAVMVLRHAERSARKLEISERRAAHDALTGLRNRSALLDQLDGAASSWPEVRRGYALLYVDLDGFKQVNDTHGHGTGDEVLRIAARRLEAAIPPGARAYRLGGDEFAVVLPGGLATAEIRAAGLRLIEALSVPMEASGVEARIGATVGVAVAASARADILDVLRDADQALYVGKRSLKGTVRFHVEAADTGASLVS